MLVLVALLFAALASSAGAQNDPARVVIVPFQGPAELAPWEVGIPAGLQRALNAVPGVYAPPIGDPAVLAERAAEAGLDPVATVHEAFRATAIVTGAIARAPEGFDVELQRLDPTGSRDGTTVTVPSDPSAALPLVVDAAIDLLGLSPSDEARSAARAVAASAPDVASLRTLGLSSARIAAPDPNDLRAAAELAPASSWVRAEWARVASLAGDHERGEQEASAATEAEPADVEAWTLLGVVRVRAGDSDGARSAYREALDRNPSHAVARVGLAGLTSGAEDAERELARALDAYPRLVEAHLQRAERQGGARALQSLRSAADRMPDSVALHREIVRRAIAAGDGGGAASYLRDAVQRPLARVPAVYALAAELPAERGDEALAILREGASAFPDDVGLAVAEARLLRRGGDPVAAEERLRPLEESAQSDLRWINETARALLAQGRTEDGRALLATAAEDDATTRYNLGQALLEAGLPRAAAEELAPLVDAQPNDADAWASYGVALAGAGRTDEARAAFDAALDLAPDHGLALRGRNRLEERVRIGGDAVDPLPQEAQAAFDRGLTDLEQGRFDAAIVAFRQASDAAPDRAVIDFYLGNALQRSGDPRRAIEAYERAADVYPGNGTLLNNIGFAWLQLGRYDRALPSLRDAVAAAPENARAHLNLGLTFYGLSRYGDALGSWDRAIELDPNLEASIADARRRAQDRIEGGAP